MSEKTDKTDKAIKKAFPRRPDSILFWVCRAKKTEDFFWRSARWGGRGD
jgi:hypothetical protein